jgi:hypothetical protein
MKKTFKLVHPKTKYARLMDSVRSEIKRYIKRERKKAFPDGFDTWDFDCKFGESADEAKTLDVSQLAQAINEAEAQKLESFYVEILAKAGHRPPKSVIEDIEEVRDDGESDEIG